MEKRLMKFRTCLEAYRFFKKTVSILSFYKLVYEKKVGWDVCSTRLLPTRLPPARLMLDRDGPYEKSPTQRRWRQGCFEHNEHM